MSPAPAVMKRSTSRVHFQDAAEKLRSRFPLDTIPADRLTFVRCLGAGEFGTVGKYEYLDQNNVKSYLALKILNRDLLANASDVDNFVNEMRTLRKLSHPYIAAYVGCGTIKVQDGDDEEPKDHIFMAQECCEGITLQDILVDQMSLMPGEQAYTWSELVSWMIGVCSGLQYMHESNPMVMHRDLKPANIILVDDGNGKKTPKLVDFGLHKVVHLHTEEEISAGVYKYAMGTRSGRNASYRGNSGRGRRKSLCRAPPKGATLELSSLNENQKQLLGKNGSVHARNLTFAGIQEQAYEMTGGCGSLVYMAPEVHKAQPYNHMVDVFSVALIFWELFAFRSQLTITDAGLGGLTIQAVNKYTMDICCGLRPPLPQAWPKLLRSLVGDMWLQDYAARPSFREIVNRLAEIKVEVEHLERKDKCPAFQGILPGLGLVEPKKPKSNDGSSASSSIKSKLKSITRHASKILKASPSPLRCISPVA